MEYKCKNCGTIFASYNPRPKFCSLACKNQDQTADIDIERLRVLYIGGKSQTEIAKILRVSQKAIYGAMKRNGIKTRKAAKRDQWGSKNHMWKGDDASIVAFHKRLYSRYGKPTICGVCGTTKAKNYDYANLSGKYEDIEDYLPMCRSCHWKFDSKHLNFQGGKKNARET